MSSILTNTSAMNALSTLRNINNDLTSTQNRISTGLKVQSAKDNASYFSISQTMKGDSNTYKAINESLTLTKNSVATARLGAESFQELAGQFVERVAFAQGADGGLDEIEAELAKIVSQMQTTISQSTFNGSDWVNAAGTTGATAASTIDATNGTLTTQATRVTGTNTIVTGVSRSTGSLTTTSLAVDTVDLTAMLSDFSAIATGFAANASDATPAGSETQGAVFMRGALATAEAAQAEAIGAATEMGLAEKSIENQQEFLNNLVDNLQSGVGAMVDANMEEEAARLQSLQVQQQLATQSLSIANQAPQNILSLFR